MNKINFAYSMKNILLSWNQHYLKCLLEKLNSFIRRLWWNYFDHHNEHAQDEDKNNYGF